MQVFQARLGDMGVDLSGRQVRMTQHELNGPQVCAMVEQVGRKRVPQRVRGNRPANARLHGIAFDGIPKVLPGHEAAATTGK